MSDRLIGERYLTDGQRRTVYANGSGVQFIIDNQGRRVYGVWLVSSNARVDLLMMVAGDKGGELPFPPPKGGYKHCPPLRSEACPSGERLNEKR